MKLNVYSPKGEKKEQVNIDFKLVDGKKSLSDRLMSQVIRSFLANRRQAIAHTKDRGEVSGGGKKPWRQKGTGRARAGSIRSPLWIGGGVTFGPRKNRHFKKRLLKTIAKKALQAAIADRIKENRFIVVSEFDFKEIKTSQMQAFLERLPIEEGKILLILAKTNPQIELSAANLKYLKTVQVSGLKLIDILSYNYLLTDKEGLKKIEDVISSSKAVQKAK